MQNMTHIQPAVRADILNSKQPSKIRLTLAGCGVAGALLLGGLFSSHAIQPTAHNQAPAARTSTVISSGAYAAQPSSMKTAQMSYTMANGYVGMAQQAAANAGINPAAFVRQIQQESGFNPNAGSPAGAEGIAQFMPGTAASMGVNPYDPSSALPGAARMMAGLAAQYGGDYSKALAAYNAGGGAVNAAVAQGGGSWLSYMPAETQHYVATIMG